MRKSGDAVEMTTLLIVPGVGGSGPGHWQTIWQNRHEGARRAEQLSWDFPDCEEWVRGTSAALEKIEGGRRVLFVAHSLGCLTVVHWAREWARQSPAAHNHTIAGALLVAPVDLETPDYPPGVGGFTPIPREPLSFPSVVVGSTNDAYCSVERSAEMARRWSSRFVDAGAVGHINVASGHGEWPAGEELLREFLAAGAEDER